MAKRICVNCGRRYNPDPVPEIIDQNMGEGAYEDYFHEVEGMCAPCAIATLNYYGDVGNAILMVNGEMDYDQDHVDRYL